MPATQSRSRQYVGSLLVIIMAVVLSSQASAQGKKQDDWFGKWRYQFVVGAFSSSVETKIRLDATDLPGTEFSFENDLGLDNNDTSFLGGFAYRFGRRSSLRLTRFSLNRSGEAESRISITLPDPDDSDDTIVIDENVVVDSFFNVDTTVLTYGYSFINNNNAEFGLRFGVHVTGLELGLNTPNQPEIPSTAEDMTAPLPTFGIQGGYRFGQNWYVIGDIGYFALKIDNIDGSIKSAVVGVLWQPFKLVGFGLNYQLFEIDVAVTSDEFGGVGGEFNWRYDGPSLYVTVRF